MSEKKEEKRIISLLNEARGYHNYLCDEQEAIKICDHILKNDPKNRDALLIKAGSQSEINKEKESFQLITKIIWEWPNHWEAYYLMGLLLFNINEEKAMANLIKSIKLNNNFNNVIATAQLLYFLEEIRYKVYLKEAKRLAPKRYKEYMKNYWEWEII